MGQITIYLDDKNEAITKAAAKASNKSVSKWIAELIEEKNATVWPQEVINLVGCWADDNFLTVEKIRSNTVRDAPREDW
ncbi:MAG: CopG family transcriptional regulator [Thermodesulfobacteriota bacterium]